MKSLENLSTTAGDDDYAESLMPTTHPVFKQIACAAMGAALFLVTGGHMALLQGVAWATMVQDFSKTASLGQAVKKTFDGHHLCPLCKKIVKTRAAAEKAPTSVKADTKAKSFVAQAVFDIPVPLCRPLVFKPAPFVAMPERSDAPPVPVPISLLA